MDVELHTYTSNSRIDVLSQKKFINTLPIEIYEIQVFYELEIKAQQHKKFSLPK